VPEKYRGLCGIRRHGGSRGVPGKASCGNRESWWHRSVHRHVLLRYGARKGTMLPAKAAQEPQEPGSFCCVHHVGDKEGLCGWTKKDCRLSKELSKCLPTGPCCLARWGTFVQCMRSLGWGEPFFSLPTDRLHGSCCLELSCKHFRAGS